MAYYIVFGSVKRPADFVGGKRLDWGQPPVGVYEADSPSDACQAAASDQGMMSTYFAVEGYAWGVDLHTAPARQLGRVANPSERLADQLDRIERLEQQKQELEARARIEAAERKRQPTREERIAAAEAESARMEREAGLDEPVETDFTELRASAVPRESPYGEEH